MATIFIKTNVILELAQLTTVDPQLKYIPNDKFVNTIYLHDINQICILVIINIHTFIHID